MNIKVAAFTVNEKSSNKFRDDLSSEQLFSLLRVHSNFATILIGKKKLVALLFVFSFWCLVIDWCVALPHGTTGLSAVCECDIF